MDLPDLGVGVVWFGGLDHWIESAGPLVDFYEVEPATVSLSPGVDAVSHADGPLARLAARGRPIVVHGVSCPIGGTIPAEEAEVGALAMASATVASAWVSEHLSLDRFRLDSGEVVATGFFLPPVQNLETVELAAAQVRRLRERTGRPVAFETGVNYLRPAHDEMSDGSFFAALADAADCYILCDLHNLWCNEINGRQPLAAVLDELPLDRICEVHLAGGQRHDGFLLDAHSNLVDPQLVAIASDVVERLPALRALTFELIPDYVGPNRILASAYTRQLEQLQRIWAARGSRTGARGRPAMHPPRRARRSVGPAAWERALRDALAGHESPLGSDPGIAIYRHLIATLRDGAVVTGLPLTYRLIALTLGLPAASAILGRYRAAIPASAWARDEVRTFAEHVREHVTGVPHLQEVLAFELAAQETEVTRRPHRVNFTCDPHRLIDPLRRGIRPPEPLPVGTYEVIVHADDA